jgi:hypothetical protein
MSSYLSSIVSFTSARFSRRELILAVVGACGLSLWKESASVKLFGLTYLASGIEKGYPHTATLLVKYVTWFFCKQIRRPNCVTWDLEIRGHSRRKIAGKKN